jgi:hypothetical protein
MIEKIHKRNRVNYFAVKHTQENTADSNTLYSTHNGTLNHNSSNSVVVPSLAVGVTGWRKLCNRTSQLALLYKYCDNQMKD